MGAVEAGQERDGPVPEQAEPRDQEDREGDEEGVEVPGEIAGGVVAGGRLIHGSFYAAMAHPAQGKKSYGVIGADGRVRPVLALSPKRAVPWHSRESARGSTSTSSQPSRMARNVPHNGAYNNDRRTLVVSQFKIFQSTACLTAEAGPPT